jgi:flagellar basal body-associated protein FliL
MAQLVLEKKPKTLQIVIGALVLLILVAGGYLVFTLFFQSTPQKVTVGQSLNTDALNANSLKLMQYDIALAPHVTTADIGRDNPFAPY